jgi:hypothetical protein
VVEKQIASAMATAEEQHAATTSKLDDLVSKMAKLSEWMQASSAATTDLAKSTALLQLHAEDTASRLALLEMRALSSGATSTEPVTPTTTVVRVDSDKQPSGRGVATTARGQELGGNRPPDPPPDHGTSRTAHYSFDRGPDSHDTRTTAHSHHRPAFGSTPKMDFPKFDGDDHQIWLDNCELYFDIYGVSAPMKVKFAALNMIGNAALWLKTIQKRQKFIHWQDLSDAVVERWGKSKHTFLMRQMLALSQTSTVAEYTTKFNTLRHQILLEDPFTSEVFFVERYLTGLRPDIRTAVVLHCPQDVDTAGLLASLQETELENDRNYSQYKYSHRDKSKPSASNTEKLKHTVRADDSKKPEGVRWDDKLEALRAYRKSKNLCFTCGEKYHRGHKCPAQIPLHIMEELLEVLQSEDSSSCSSESENDLMLLAPLSASSKPRQRRTMRLHGMIDKQHILILIDSGANSSFVSSSLAVQLDRETADTTPARFVAANGAPLVSSKIMPQLQWLCQGHSFQYDFHVLDLPCYDMILGADWLEDHSPMWVHWRKRWMRFTHNQRRVHLQGIREDSKPCRPVTAAKLHGLLRRGAIVDCIQVQPVHQEAELNLLSVDTAFESVPIEVQELLHEFDSLFKEPEDLPPRRACDHQVPLVPGAQPVSVRPYRYTPIKKQRLSDKFSQCSNMGQSALVLVPLLHQSYWFARKTVRGDFVWITDS